jgi:serralysin
MMNDIKALQFLYGADYSTNNGNTVYSWSAKTGEMFIDGAGQGAPGGNRIFLTVWDGGGTDTYDFSNYITNLKVDLQPGGWTTTAASQLANLGNGHYARGNIANALLYNDNPASHIENAKGGSGADTIIGNSASNVLWGNAGGDALKGLIGNDVLIGGEGDDVLEGGSGTDIALYFGRVEDFCWCENGDGSFTILDLRENEPQGMDILMGIEFLQFSDEIVRLPNVDAAVAALPAYGTSVPTGTTEDGLIATVAAHYDDEVTPHNLPAPDLLWAA